RQIPRIRKERIRECDTAVPGYRSTISEERPQCRQFIEESVSRAHDHQPIAFGIPRQSKPWSEMEPAIEHELPVLRHARVAGHLQAGGRSRICRAHEAGIELLIREEDREPAEIVVRREKGLITEAIIHSEMLRGFPRILQIQREVSLPRVNIVGDSLGELRWISRKEIRHYQTGLRLAAECKRRIGRDVGLSREEQIAPVDAESQLVLALRQP